MESSIPRPYAVLALAKEKPESSLKKDTSLHMVNTLTKDLDAPNPPEAKFHQGQKLILIRSPKDCIARQSPEKVSRIR
jgi:hypothetical protein